MNPPLVSVIIPTFNRGYCVAKSIRSVLAQGELELIVVNDGSKDATAKELASFPTIKVINLAENHGVSYARNRGLERARGSLICFLDSDDLWEEGKLKAQVQWMKLHPECMAVYTDEIWIRNGVRVNPMKKHQKLKLLCQVKVLMKSAKVIYISINNLGRRKYYLIGLNIRLHKIYQRLFISFTIASLIQISTQCSSRKMIEIFTRY